MLEAAFGIAYIAETRSEERALAYLLARIKRQIKKLRKGDLTHPEGQQTEADLSSDAFSAGILGKLPQGLSKRADEIETRLNTEAEFAPILTEWNLLKHPPGKKRQSDPDWFALFSGPKPIKDVRSLALHLRWLSLYEFFYRDWSNSVHAGDAIENYSTSDECIRPLRYPAKYTNAMSMAFCILINGIERLATFYDAELGQQFRQHVNNNLAPRLTSLSERIEQGLGSWE